MDLPPIMHTEPPCEYFIRADDATWKCLTEAEWQEHVINLPEWLALSVTAVFLLCFVGCVLYAALQLLSPFTDNERFHP